MGFTADRLLSEIKDHMVKQTALLEHLVNPGCAGCRLCQQSLALKPKAKKR